MPTLNILQSNTLNAYFYETLNQEVRQLQNEPLKGHIPGEEALWYIGNMLSRFSASDALFSWDGDHYGVRPLALIYQDALETPNTGERNLLLQQLGDLALFFAALFPQSFRRRGLGVDYLIGMGSGAYRALLESDQNRHALFSELALHFPAMSHLISKACSREHFIDHEEILRLYQRWLDSRDPLLQEQLEILGIHVQSSAERAH